MHATNPAGLPASQSTTSLSARLARRRHWLLAAGFYALVLGVMLYPVSVRPAQVVNGRPFDDVFEYIWYLAWYKRALLDLRVSPLFVPEIFYPTGWNLGFAAFPPVHPTLLAPVTALLGPVLTHNLALLAASLLSGLAVYGIAHRLGSGTGGALLAGAIYMLAPQRTMYLGGHLNMLLASTWLAVAVYALLVARQQPRRRMAWLAGAGFALALSMGAAWHYAFLGGLTVGLALLVLLGPEMVRRPRSAVGWLAALAAPLLLLAPLLVHALRVKQAMGGDQLFSFAFTNSTSTSLEALITPSLLNPLVAADMRTVAPFLAERSVVYLGISVLLLALLGWSTGPHRRGRRAMQVLAAAGLALTLGITLHIHAQPVMLPGWLAALPLPTELQGPAGGRMAPLPAYLLYKAVPPFRAFHGFDRWVVVALLGLAPLAGLGLTRLAAALPWPRVGRVLQGGFLALLLLEFNLFPLLNTTSMDQMDRAVDRWLAAQPASGVIVEMPLDYAEKGNTLYYWLHHGQAMVHGQGSLMPPAYLARRPVLAQWPAEPALDLLADLGVQYVLQHAFVWERDFETTTLPALAANPRLRLVEVFPHHDGVTRAIYLFALEEE